MQASGGEALTRPQTSLILFLIPMGLMPAFEQGLPHAGTSFKKMNIQFLIIFFIVMPWVSGAPAFALVIPPLCMIGHMVQL